MKDKNIVIMSDIVSAASILPAALHLDLESAREIQRRALPGRLPQIHGLDYYGECHPAAAVGGDFFDFLSLPERGLAVTVGDVSGHGIGPAIMMSSLQAFLRGLTAHGCGEISSMVEELNRAVHQTSPDNFYATLFYAHIDPVRRELHYVSAGHEPALLIRRTGRVYQLDSTGTVLGLTDRSAYSRRTVPLEPGDVLVAFTDGITEAADEQGREFCQTGVLQVVRRHPKARASDLVRDILTEADCYTACAGPVDDRTAVVVRFVGKAEERLPEAEACELAFAAA